MTEKHELNEQHKNVDSLHRKLDTSNTSSEEIIQINKWLKLTEDDPDNLDRIELISIEDSKEITTGHTTIQTFDTYIKETGSDELIRIHPHFFARPKNQDVIDFLSYFTWIGEDGQETFMVAVNKSGRAPLVARKELVPHRFGEESLASGKAIELMGTYMDWDQGDISTKDAATRGQIAKTPLRAKKDASTIPLSPYYSAISSLSEACIGKLLEVNPPETLDPLVIHGKEFDEREVHYYSLQGIIDGYFDGSIQCSRLIHLTLELARKKGIPLHIPTSIPDVNTSTSYPSIQDMIISHSKLDTYIDKTLIKKNNIEEVILIEKPELYDGDAFQTKKNIKVKNVRNNGREEIYTAEVVVRNTVDTIEIVPHFWDDGKLLMPVKAMLRPGPQSRNHEPHPINLEAKLYNIEGISGSVSGSEKNKNDIIQTGSQLMRDKAGYTQKHDLSYGSASFTSIGVNAEKKYSLYVKDFDPTKHNIEVAEKEYEKYTPTVFYMDIDEILAAADQGTIQDPHLIMNANILKQKYQYKSIEGTLPRTGTEEEYATLQELMSRPLQTDQLMKQAAALHKSPGLYDAHIFVMKTAAVYRKQNAFVEQILGGVIQNPKNIRSERDKDYFESSNPYYGPQGLEVIDRYNAPAYLGHDNAHQRLGGIAIVDPDSGELLVSEEEFVYRHTRQEAYAVCISDYLLPKQVGFEKFESFLGIKKCVGRTLEELGIENFDQALQLIIQMERDGHIPDEILQKKAYKDPDNRANIMRIIGFNPNDKKQSRDEYTYWSTNREVAKVKAKFMNVSSSEEEVTSKMDEYKDLIDTFPEGNNSFKSYVSSHIVTHTTNPAMRAGVLKQYIVDSAFEGYEKACTEVDKLIDTLYWHQQYIKKTRDMITSMNYNNTNIKALRRITFSKQKTEETIEAIETLIQETPYINESQRTELTSNYIAWFQGFKKYDDQENKRLINKLEQKNLVRAGVSLDPYYNLEEQEEQKENLDPRLEIIKQNESIFRAILKDLKENREHRHTYSAIPSNIDLDGNIEELYEKYVKEKGFILLFQVKGNKAQIHYQEYTGTGAALEYDILASGDIQYSKVIGISRSSM